MPKAAATDYKPLARSGLPVDTLALARYLIGKIVVRKTRGGLITGRIVETEAYPPGDASGHGFHGETASNRALFLNRGYAHVYLAYGVSWMFNVSSGAAGVGAGVLIRAAEPIDGIAIMQRNRGVDTVRDLARGPGRLAKAFAIDMKLDGVDLCREGPVWLAHGSRGALDIGTSIRIGITKEADRLRRFYVRGSPYVSGTKALNA